MVEGHFPDIPEAVLLDARLTQKPGSADGCARSYPSTIDSCVDLSQVLAVDPCARIAVTSDASVCLVRCSVREVGRELGNRRGHRNRNHPRGWDYGWCGTAGIGCNMLINGDPLQVNVVGWQSAWSNDAFKLMDLDPYSVARPARRS